jgi:uncharacterized protein (DUF433 family)
MDGLFMINGDDNSRELLARITFTDGKRSGQACIRGMRITVTDILGYLASGLSEADLIEDFPELEPEDVRAALCYSRLFIEMHDNLRQ